MKRQVKREREYIPRWFPWFLLPIVIPLMVWIQYLSTIANIDIFIALGVIATLIIGIALIFFVSYKRIPIG